MNTTKCPIKHSAIALAVTVAAGIPPVSVAQEDTTIEEISVTGSRLRMTDGMAEPTPVTSVTPQELMNYEPGGTVAEQLDALPQFFLTGTAQRGGPTLWGDGGGSYLDMRGLGRNRTLVLLDGTRIVPADKGSTVNVDNIPMGLVRSVDVITGGASAAYGADALAGVTNFVLDRDFQGLEATVSAGMNEFNRDGKNYRVEVSGGFNIGERWNFIGSFQGQRIDEIYRDPRDLDSDWFRRWGTIPNTDPDGPDRITMPMVAPTDTSPSGVISAPGSALNGLQFTDDGSDIRPLIRGDYTAGGFTSGGPDAQRYSDATSSPITGNGVDNRTGFAALKYQATEDTSIYVQALYGHTQSYGTSRHATFSMTFPWYQTIYRENPYIPESVATIMDAEGLTSFQMNKVGSYPEDFEAGAGEYSDTVFTTESYTIGFNTVLPNDWDLSGSYQSGESSKVGGEYPSVRVDREALARDVVRDPETGAIVCNVQLYNPTTAELAASPSVQGLTDSRNGGPLLSPIGLDNSVRDCVPYNAMGAGNMTQSAWEYMHTPRSADSWVKQDFAELLLQGEAHQGWGAGPLSFATGLTWRDQSFHDEAAEAEIDAFGPPLNDPLLGIRGIAGAYAGGTPNLHHFATVALLDGEYDVWEVFGELNVPIWESGNGNHYVGGNLAARRSDYSSSGEQDSWKAGLEWQVFSDLRLRATRSRDVREASFAERFDNDTGGTLVDDPKTGQMNVNVTYFRGGNPELEPEEADTTVLGLVYEPAWLEGLRLSTDWYEIDISGAVDSITEQQVVDQCFETGALCDLINRDDNDVIVGVGAPFLNLSTSYAEGIDYEVRYQMEPNFFSGQLENLSIRGLFGYLKHRYDQPPGGDQIDLVGSSTRPEYTGNLTFRYLVGPWSFSWTQRYISDTLVNINWEEGVDIDDNTIPSYSFTNLQFQYTGEAMMGGGEWAATLSVNNAFDKNPPIIPGAVNRIGSQTNSGLGYDEFGRRYQLTLSMNF